VHESIGEKRRGNVDITGSRVLSTSRNDNIEYINKDLISPTKYPCARGIANAWHEFRNKVYENDGNLYSAGLFSNPGLRNRMGKCWGEEIYLVLSMNSYRNKYGIYHYLEDGIRDKGEIQEIM
jgi:hypothetical protein